MDLEVFQLVNQYAGRSEALDTLFRWCQQTVPKAAIFGLAIWSIWFSDVTETERRARREHLVAVLLLSAPLILAARLAANYLPFRFRPIHTPGLEINLAVDQDVKGLDGWSSMPSDHAIVFFALATGIFMLHRGWGTVLLLWAAFVVCLPRIYFGWHWPSDILVGAVLAIVATLIALPFVNRFIHWIRIVPFFEARTAIGYPLLFLATFELVTMFEFSRLIFLGAFTD